MSIELKQAAQQALNALDEATTYTGSPSWSPSMTDECIAAASALRAALAPQPDNASCKSVQKRLETQQPATGEPVAWLHVCRKKPELRELSFSKAWPNLAALGYKARPLVLGDTHPAPSVPGEKPLPDLMMASYHEAIGWNACRAAMLAAK